MRKMAKKFTKLDWKTMIVGLVFIALFIVARKWLTGTIDWAYIMDTFIALFAVGVFLFILKEMFGSRIANAFK
jgi:hypothetical protein